MINKLEEQDSQVVELKEIYSEMDLKSKETIVAAAEKLLVAQKTLADDQAAVQEKAVINDVSGFAAAKFGIKKQKSRFAAVAVYFVLGILLLFATGFFWDTLINPALLKIGVTPLIMVRIILTALIGVFCLGSGLVGFLHRWMKIPLLFLLIFAGLGCIDPGILTDFVGFALIFLIAAVLVIQKKRKKEAVI